jgi:hypothetical protein
MKSDIKIGDFAVCKDGHAGVILSIQKNIVKKTKKFCKIYVGLHVGHEKFGKLWQSKNPKKITKKQLREILDGKLI